MTAHSSRPDPPPPPLSKWIIWVGTLVVFAGVLAVAAVSWFMLRRLYGGQGAQIQLDVIRTTGTLVIGTGGAVALLLTARRQRYIELTLVHTDRDATEQRITELYTKAADQLGSEQAPVRLAGLYALERLAHSTVEHRQSIVDVICAYLRMPFTPPLPQQQRSYRSPGPARRRRVRPLSDRPPHTTPTSRGAWHEQAKQEQQVRLTAQGILSRNLCVTAQRRRWWHRTPPPAAPVWPGVRLDLTGALLFKFFLLECQLYFVNFQGAQFTGGTSFDGTKFTGGANFADAKFTDWADFEGAEFADWVFFLGADFTSGANFKRAKFTGVALFADAEFTGRTNFGGAQFTGRALFVSAKFTDGVFFGDAEFTDGVDFEGARVASAAEPGSVWPPGWTTRSAKNGEDPAFLYLTKVEENSPPDA